MARNFTYGDAFAVYGGQGTYADLSAAQLSTIPVRAKRYYRIARRKVVR